MTRFVVLVFSLVASVGSASRMQGQKKHHGLLKLHGEQLESIPVQMYKADCWKKRPIALTQLAQTVFKTNKHVNPGAGMEPGSIEPFARVLKDGFFEVACVKDYMYEHGDKFGANKFSYKEGNIPNVSIVHYTDVVPKEDQEPMTQEVCFEFCRTVPDMGFFGITQGRDCYCEPYYKQMAGDGDICDAVCEGDSTTMCGSMTKSSIFAMHMCASTEADLASAAEKATNFASKMEVLGGDALDTAEQLQSAAEGLQERFGSAGDPTASALMQDAKVFAGDLQHAAEDTNKIAAQLNEMTSKADGMAGGDFTAHDKVQEAESTMDGIEKLMAEGESSLETTLDLHSLAIGKEVAVDEADQKGDEMEEEESEEKGDEGESKALKPYYPVMYFVDREFEKVPSTCGGDTLKKPIFGTADDCAAACSAEGIACAGFSFFAYKRGVCIMFSKFKSVQYYTECGSGEDSKKGLFLQEVAKSKAALSKQEPEATMCYAKFSSFTGTTLKPDPSGKCKLCMKKATKAQRCFE